MRTLLEGGGHGAREEPLSDWLMRDSSRRLSEAAKARGFRRAALRMTTLAVLASNAGCRVWSREVRRREAAPLKAKGAAPAQKQKQIPRAAALVMTTRGGYGVAQGETRTRLLWAARLRFKARAPLASGARSKARRGRHPTRSFGTPRIAAEQPRPASTPPLRLNPQPITITPP